MARGVLIVFLLAVIVSATTLWYARHSLQDIVTRSGMAKPSSAELPLAAKSAKWGRVALLLGEINANSEDSDGLTALDYAMEQGEDDVVALLLRHGALRRELGRSAPKQPSFVFSAPITPSRNMSGPAAQLRVMTYNIRYSAWPRERDMVNGWPFRVSRIAATIRSYRPDIVGLQEVLPQQLSDLRPLLPEYAAFGVGRDADGGGEMTVTLHRKDRLRVAGNPARQETVWLGPHDITPGRKAWDAQCSRTLTWTDFHLTDGGKSSSPARVMHFNTHLDHRGNVSRVESAQIILERLRTHLRQMERERKEESRRVAEETRRDEAEQAAPEPQRKGRSIVVLTGDLNSRPTSAAYRLLTGKRLLPPALEEKERVEPDVCNLYDRTTADAAVFADARECAEEQFGLRPTFTGFTQRTHLVLDFLLVAAPPDARVRVTQHIVVPHLLDRVHASPPSDHCAVVMDLEF